LKNDVNIKGYYKAIVDAEINEEAVIKVEKSHAAILCLSALNDIVWPSKMASEKVVERLKNSDYPFDYQHITFDKVSHFLCPTPKEYAKKLKIFKIEKQHPNECNESREKSFELAVDWIKKYNNTDCEIRPIKPEEIDVLDDFLYEAIFQPDINNLAPKSIIEKPELQIYIKDFGKPDDNCLVAVCDGKIVGAVWTRIIDGFGSVDEKTPEFAISLFREFRGRGIGTNLMREMLELLRVKGYKQTSLAVQKKNYAVKMYKAIGFEIAKELDEEYLMIYKF
jgi:ribosomal protein S18 acetylase RimI-like enzyme